MKLGRRLLLLVAFMGLAAAAALSIDRVVQPHATSELLLAAGMGVAVALPGLVHRRFAPTTLLLLPLGLYLLMRLVVPLPPDSAGWHEQYRFYANELNSGISAYANDIFPLSLTGVPGLRLLVLVWFYLGVGLAAFLSLDGRRPLPGVGVLLALLAAGLTVDAERRDPLLAVAFLVLAITVVMTAQSLSRRSWGFRDALTGLGLGWAGVVVALALLTLHPGLAEGGWQDWREWDPFGPGAGGGTVFNWKQNYPRLLDPGNNEPVMRVTSPAPTYWRATTLETFNGDAWISDLVFRYPVPDGPGFRHIESPELVPPGDEVTVRFELVGVITNYLFVAGRPKSLSLSLPFPIYASDAASLRSALNLTSPVEYTLTAVMPRVRPEDVVGRGRDYPQDPGFKDTYLTLPPLPESDFGGLPNLNATIIGNATDPYEQALLIEEYLRDNFEYSLSIPESPLYSPIAEFLFDTRTGYCQHFAGAMALLLRFNGVPSRVAVGFTTGNLVGGRTYRVTTNNAHAWVEAYFPGVGWLPFEPTPGRSIQLPGASSTSPGFADPFLSTKPEGTSTTASTVPSPTQRPPKDTEGAVNTGAGTTGRKVATRAGASVAILLAAAALWPRLRRRVRERGLRRGEPVQRLRASLTLLRADLADWGVTATPATTLEELSTTAAAGGAGDLLSVIERAQAVLFGGYAASFDDVRQAEGARRKAVLALRRRHRRVWTVLSWYGLACPVRRLLPRLAFPRHKPRRRGRPSSVRRETLAS